MRVRVLKEVVHVIHGIAVRTVALVIGLDVLPGVPPDKVRIRPGIICCIFGWCKAQHMVGTPERVRSLRRKHLGEFILKAGQRKKLAVRELAVRDHDVMISIRDDLIPLLPIDLLDLFRGLIAV